MSRKLHRLAINQLSMRIGDVDVDNHELNVRSYYSSDRITSATENNIKSVAKEIMEKWLKLEYENLSLYKTLWYDLLDTENEHAIILANFVKEKFDHTASKIKYIERRMMDYSSHNYNVWVLKQECGSMHDHYAEKMHGVAIIE